MLEKGSHQEQFSQTAGSDQASLAFQEIDYRSVLCENLHINSGQVKRVSNIVFYIDKDATSPVLDFLTSLDTKTQVKFAWSIDKLRERNINAQYPLARRLEGPLWELREEGYRLIFFFSDQNIVLLHGFKKKTHETSRSEIEIALKRYRSFIAR